jgi:hypothetical protein
LEEQTEEGQLSGVATRHAKKNKAQQRRTLILHLPLTLNFTPAPHPPPSTLPPTPRLPIPPPHARQGGNKRQMKQNLNFKIRKNSEHELSTTHYLIQNLSLHPEIEFCHLFHFYPIPTREFFLYRKKKCKKVP